MYIYMYIFLQLHLHLHLLCIALYHLLPLYIYKHIYAYILFLHLTCTCTSSALLCIISCLFWLEILSARAFTKEKGACLLWHYEGSMKGRGGLPHKGSWCNQKACPVARTWLLKKQAGALLTLWVRFEKNSVSLCECVCAYVSISLASAKDAAMMMTRSSARADAGAVEQESTTRTGD